jgi:hypothetical protein
MRVIIIGFVFLKRMKIQRIKTKREMRAEKKFDLASEEVCESFKKGNYLIFPDSARRLKFALDEILLIWKDKGINV